MRRTQWGALALAVSGLLAGPASAEVVISQAYGGGGNAGAVFSNDFIELFNAGDTPVSLSGRSVQYASATGTGNFGASDNQLAGLPAVTLQPGQYFLVELAAGSNTSLPALPDPDSVGAINAAGGAGKFALVEGTASLGCNGGSAPCSPEQLDRIIDLLGWGNANFFDGAGAAPGTANATAVIRGDAGCQVSGNNNLDFTVATPTPRNSASAANPCGGDPANPILSINDVSLPEGDEGVTVFDFTVTLFPVLEQDVSFDIATADGTAEAGVDYIANSVTGATIAAGESTYTFSVDVLGNLVQEPDKTFFVNLTNAGADDGTGIEDAQAVGTIVNDDFDLTTISAIQGVGPSSPLLGQDVAVRGIVTARKNNGYFIQSLAEDDDGNPETSEGLFIFTTAGGVPEAAQPGNLVQVVGTVAEFVPATAPDQLPLVQLTFADTQLLGTGNTLPAPVVLGLEDLSPENDVAYLERFIGMRVSVPELVVVSPSLGSTNTTTGTASNNGVFVATHPEVARPFREPGIGVLEQTPFPEGVEPPIFDTNPERLRIQSNAQPGAQSLQVSVGDTVEGIVGVLDYAFVTYSILPDPGTASVVPGAQVRNVAPADAREISIGTYNLFNLPNNPNNQRLIKTSRAICEGMGAPAVVGLQESFGESAISALAEAINTNLSGFCPENVNYEFIAPANPNGSIQLALLYDTALNEANLPRAELVDFELVGVDERVDNPNGSQSVLNDRPPLVAEIIAALPSGETVELSVVVLHQRSLIGVNSLESGPSGWATEGERVRDKRLRASVWLSEFVEQRQTAQPDRPMVLLGDFNAFEFSDGFVDALGIITGFPAAEDEVLLFAESALSVPLLNLVLTVPEEDRYSYSFDGNAQVLDHIVVNAATLEQFEDVRMEFARINADFAVALFGDVESPARASDHDPAVAFLRLAEAVPEVADAQLSSPGRNMRLVAAGTTATLFAELTNLGPDALVDPMVNLQVGGTTDPVSLEAPEGWSCGAIEVDQDSARVQCSFEGSFPAGRRDGFNLLVATRLESGAQRLTHSGSVEAANDPDLSNNSFRFQSAVAPGRGR